jgi:hypothetical protein
MITVQDLCGNAKMRMVLALDFDHGAYQNTYQSVSYPRLVVVKAGAGYVKGKTKQYCTTQYFVDDIEVDDLEQVAAMLNTEPHPRRGAS